MGVRVGIGWSKHVIMVRAMFYLIFQSTLTVKWNTCLHWIACSIVLDNSMLYV